MSLSGVPQTVSRAVSADLLLEHFFYDHAQDGVFLADPFGVLLYANTRLLSILGYKRASELLGRSILSEIWETTPAFDLIWRRVLSQQRTFLPAVRLRARSQQESLISFSAICLTSPTGEPLAVRGLLSQPSAGGNHATGYRLLTTISDVIGRSLDQQRILEAALTTIAALMRAPVAIARVLDAPGTSLVQVKEIGVPPQADFPVRVPARDGLLGAVLESGAWLLLDDASADPRLSHAERQLDQRSFLVAPLRIQMQTIGVLALAAPQPGYFSLDDAELLTSASLQVGAALERAQLHQIVAEKEQLLSYSMDQLENVRDPIITLDLQGHITWLNRAAEEVVGYARAGLLEHPFTELVAPQDSSALLAALLSPADNASICEVTLMTANGREAPLEMRVTPLVRAGRRVGAQLVGRDVRQRRQLERDKESFLVSVSHDLQSPLSAIMGYSEFLLSGAAGHLTDTQTQFVEVIVQSCRHQLALLHDLLEISRLESPHFELEKNWVWLDQRLSWFAQAALPGALEKQVDLRVHLEDNLPPVWADPSRIERVITNLISNAIKYTNPGGRVDVRAARDADNQMVRVAVSDTGVGIEPEDLPRLFDKYQRGRLAKSNSESTGLGLHIARDIIEAHGGRIGVESVPGRGSKFWFTLPVRQS